MNHYQLLYLKEEYPYHKIIMITFLGQTYLFRSLTREEYKTLLKMGEDELTFEDMTCQLALIYPEDFDFGSSPIAGLSRMACPLIIKHSSFETTDELFQTYDYYQNMNQRFESECMNIIKAAMPEYTYEELETWTWDKIMAHVARAERVLYLRGIDNIKLERNEEANLTEGLDIDNPNDVMPLLEKGIDPMLYLSDQLQVKKKNPFDCPFLGGSHWKDEEVLHAIRTQMGKAQASRR